MNFKVNLRWYYEDCYFLTVNEHDILHVIVHALSGGDSTVDFYIEDPKKQIVESKKKTAFNWYDNSDIKVAGDYKVCTKNLEHHEKKVYVNLIVFSKSQVHSKKEELKNLTEAQNYMMNRITSINENVHSMRRSQIVQRMIHSADEYFIQANNEFIMNYSIIQSIVIIISGLIQTIFIKKLFHSPKSKKPLA